jgi:hypothetical protein
VARRTSLVIISWDKICQLIDGGFYQNAAEAYSLLFLCWSFIAEPNAPNSPETVPIVEGTIPIDDWAVVAWFSSTLFVCHCFMSPPGLVNCLHEHESFIELAILWIFLVQVFRVFVFVTQDTAPVFSLPTGSQGPDCFARSEIRHS